MLDKKQLSKEIGMCPTSIDRLRKKGMPFYKIGKSVRFDLQEVMEWLKKIRG